MRRPSPPTLVPTACAVPVGWRLGERPEDEGNGNEESLSGSWSVPNAAPPGLAVAYAHSPAAPVPDDETLYPAVGPLTRRGAPRIGKVHQNNNLPGTAPTLSLPEPGDQISGFRIVSELGRGAFARVYLAEQAELGDRPVALKVSNPEGDEPRRLARLRHPHIVPIHSVHLDPDTGLRLLCMPYLGGANLAQVLTLVRGGQPESSVPRNFLDALNEVSRRFPPGDPASSGVGPCDGRHGPGVDSPARHFLRRATPIQAAVWVVARLAEAVEYAHTRGLVHRDLKPSNVLVADDGTPMLLDFNLATDIVPAGPDQGEMATLGGTLLYMSPEHLDAFNLNGATHADPVNEQSDVYALGLILFEMVAGRSPFADAPNGRPLLEVVRTLAADQRRAAPSLRKAHPATPWGLDAIVKMCLEPNPDRRYLRARDLAEDLNRFLDDLPLRYAPEPCLCESAVKWVRRNSRLRDHLAIAGLVALQVISSLVLIGVDHHAPPALSTPWEREEVRDDVARCRNLSGEAGKRAGQAPDPRLTLACPLVPLPASRTIQEDVRPMAEGGGRGDGECDGRGGCDSGCRDDL